MAISFIGQAGAAATSVTVPVHAIGDMIIIIAYRTAVTAPTLPAGYTNVVTNTGNANSFRIGYKIATATNDASGTWTNATLVNCVVYRGAQQIGATNSNTKAAATTADVPTLTLFNPGSTSWVVAFAASKQATSQGTPLAGATTSRGTQLGTLSACVIADTNGVVNAFAATTSSNNTSVTSIGASVELVVTPSMKDFVDPLLISTQDTSKWGGNFGTLSWSPKGFTITNPLAYTGYGGDNSNLFYDMTGAACYCNMPTAGSQALASCETVPFKLVADANNSLFWYINGGTLQAFKQVAGMQTSLVSVPYVSAAMQWFLVSESGGVTTFAYSADGVAWVVPSGGSVSNPVAVTSLMVEPSLGTFSSELTATSAVWNSFNTGPAQLGPWLAALPDRLNRSAARRHTTPDPGYYYLPVTAPVITEDMWEPYFPDYLYRLKDRRAMYPATIRPDFNPPEDIYIDKYRGYQPDQLFRLKDRRYSMPVAPQGTSPIPNPETITVDKWLGYHPDSPPRAKDRRHIYPNFVTWMPLPESVLAWRPNMPDYLSRLKSRRHVFPVAPQDTFPQPNPETVTLDKYRGYQPDYLYRLKDRRYLFPGFVRREFEVPVAPVLVDKFQPILPPYIWRNKPRTYAFPYLSRFENILFTYCDPLTLWQQNAIPTSGWVVTDPQATGWSSIEGNQPGSAWAPNDVGGAAGWVTADQPGTEWNEKCQNY